MHKDFSSSCNIKLFFNLLCVRLLSKSQLLESHFEIEKKVTQNNYEHQRLRNNTQMIAFVSFEFQLYNNYFEL